MTPDELMARLRALPGVTVQEGDAPANYSYYILHFTQPVDHNDLSKGTFQQEVSLLHRNERAPFPLIIYTSGYGDETPKSPVELTTLLDANQVSIEYRFYGTSVPDPVDWSKLTIEQAAADEHDIITQLHTIYDGAFLSVGESKGGIAALTHRSIYPGDVKGTVMYVTPLSLTAPDERFPPYFDHIGPADCRSAVRNVAIEMLNRRTRMVAHAQGESEHAYTRVQIGPATEAAIAGLEWGFWQLAGDCNHVPLTTASDDDLYAFLRGNSPVSEYDDKHLSAYEPYYYQTYTQLGYPDYSVPYLTGELWYDDDDYTGEFPATEPAYDSTSVNRVQDWLQDASNEDKDPVTHKSVGKHLMFIYGAWDPWFAGRVGTGEAGDTHTYVNWQGSHMTKLATLDAADRVQAFSNIQRWSGVEPVLWRLDRQAAPEVHEGEGVHPPGLLIARARAAPR
ncbi:MAG TPA: S28 family serine protease [Kofleriaceae bacterium]|nr:S28 family serine protease [Kofleriaceae bacterium]